MRRMGFDFNESADPRIKAMQKAIRDVGGKIEFTIEQHPRWIMDGRIKKHQRYYNRLSSANWQKIYFTTQTPQIYKSKNF